jgi:hypothetical protein
MDFITLQEVPDEVVTFLVGKATQIRASPGAWADALRGYALPETLDPHPLLV